MLLFLGGDRALLSAHLSRFLFLPSSFLLDREKKGGGRRRRNFFAPPEIESGNLKPDCLRIGGGGGGGGLDHPGRKVGEESFFWWPYERIRVLIQ